MRIDISDKELQQSIDKLILERVEQATSAVIRKEVLDKVVELDPTFMERARKIASDFLKDNRNIVHDRIIKKIGADDIFHKTIEDVVRSLGREDIIKALSDATVRYIRSGVDTQKLIREEVAKLICGIGAEEIRNYVHEERKIMAQLLKEALNDLQQLSTTGQLSKEQKERLKVGIAYYNKFIDVRAEALPPDISTRKVIIQQ